MKMKNFTTMVVPICVNFFYLMIFNISKIVLMKHHTWILRDTGSKVMFSVENLRLTEQNLNISLVFEKSFLNQSSGQKSNYYT